MTLKEKQYIAAAARGLINALSNCDDGDFVDFVIGCVGCGDDILLAPENIDNVVY